jgi:hypothetical protein
VRECDLATFQDWSARYSRYIDDHEEWERTKANEPDPDPYKFMLNHKEYFDTSNMPKEGFLYDETTAKVLGRFKDECSANLVLEFVGLKAKSYSYIKMAKPSPMLCQKDVNKTILFPIQDYIENAKECHRAKGINRAASKLLRHEEYKRMLFTPYYHGFILRRIGQRHHILKTYQARKRGLCAFDNKVTRSTCKIV